MEISAPQLHTVPSQREFHADNLRFFLIFSVVLGHLLEICPPFLGSRFLYQLIYSFHIPALLFLFGYFCRFSPGRLLMSWVFPYFLFQTLYLLFEIHVMGEDLSLQYLTPHWLLWYLVVCIYYQLLLLLYRRIQQPSLRGLLIAGCFLLAVLVGFVDAIAYSASLSRFFVFQPFFLLGLYSRGDAFPRSNGRLWALSLGGLTVFSLGFFFLYGMELPNVAFYGARSYTALGITWWHRSAILLTSLAAVISLFALSRLLLNRRLPLITRWGQNTLPIFLLHGFGVKLIGKYLPAWATRPWEVFLLALALVLILGNPLLGKTFHYLFSVRLFSRKKP